MHYATVREFHQYIIYLFAYIFLCRPCSSVGRATGYGLEGPRIESQWGRDFSAPVQTGPGAHPASCTIGTRSFPGVKSGQGVTLTPHPLLVPLAMKEYSYTSTPPTGRTACTEPYYLYSGTLYLFLCLSEIQQFFYVPCSKTFPTQRFTPYEKRKIFKSKHNDT